MDESREVFVEDAMPRDRLALLLDHFSQIDDDRDPARVAYPLSEVLLLVTCATIASCDDFDDIAAWGEHHLAFPRRFSPFHFGIPRARWLRALVNRVDAAVRRFALGLVRANKSKGSVKTRRKSASWNPDFLLEILQQQPR